MPHKTHKRLFLVRLATLAGGIISAAVLPAQTSTWFPLEVGNTWMYRPSPGNRTPSDEGRTIWVQGKENAGGKEYYRVSYFGRDVLLRPDGADGPIVAYDRTSGAEQTWLSPGLPVGGTFTTQINPCPTSGTIEKRGATVATPAGSFSNVVQIRFQGSCADVGATQQFYAADVGLVSGEDTSFAGPIKYELAYYRVGTRTGAAPETSFTLALDSSHYPVGATLQARLTLRSTNETPIHLVFPSSQSYDLKIFSDKGDVAYAWSAARSFAMVYRAEEFGPGEHTYSLSAPLGSFPPGRYTVQGWLTTQPLMYLGQVSFEIVPDQTAAADYRRPDGAGDISPSRGPRK